MKRFLAVGAAMLVACSSAPSQGPVGSPSSVSPSPTPTAPSPEPQAQEIRFPGPNTPVPGSARRLTKAVVSVNGKLPIAIDRWLDAGGARLSRSGHRVALGALWQQRLYRSLVVHRAVRAKVFRRLPGPLSRSVRRHVVAGAGLRALSSPLTPPVRLKTTPPSSHRSLRRSYKEGQRRFGVPWYVLASVNFVESKFGRLLGPSSAGARGPMQFIPSTWDAYGNGGDIMDPRDSIVAAARYLHASGAPSDMRGALFAYNRSYAYVDAIQIYAREMRRKPRTFYAYYLWQVFVRTTEGDRQLTGPGRDR